MEVSVEQINIHLSGALFSPAFLCFPFFLDFSSCHNAQKPPFNITLTLRHQVSHSVMYIPLLVSLEQPGIGPKLALTSKRQIVKTVSGA